ncbi:uncharacterized protein LOC119448860 [Dermacentor silvarum]|uniref:uncharacterized protein LOC119448860 n=1 Tax=Dermacentor silvarum TaxID=543639 RepID=UPI002100BE11|nr:uncharacterized protein LOC119448860 [Dermacentor silvarum]
MVAAQVWLYIGPMSIVDMFDEVTGSTALRRPTLPKLPKIPKIVRNLGSAAKEQHIDPHIDQKIDVFLDLAPSPDDSTGQTGYNGTGISGAPHSRTGSGMVFACGECSCKFPLDIDIYAPQQGCTLKVKKLSCSCKRSSCYMNQVAKCLENVASEKCYWEARRVICL